MRPLQWWADSAPPGGDRVKVSEYLGATSVAPVAPVDTSLTSMCIPTYSFFGESRHSKLLLHALTLLTNKCIKNKYGDMYANLLTYLENWGSFFKNFTVFLAISEG